MGESGLEKISRECIRNTSALEIQVLSGSWVRDQLKKFSNMKIPTPHKHMYIYTFTHLTYASLLPRLPTFFHASFQLWFEWEMSLA